MLVVSSRFELLGDTQASMTYVRIRVRVGVRVGVTVRVTVRVRVRIRVRVRVRTVHRHTISP